MNKQKHGIAVLLRKGGPHQKAKSAERQKARKAIKNELAKINGAKFY